MIEEEGIGLTFSDEDFDRRYSSESASAPAGPAASPSTSPAGRPKPLAPPIGRSRNKFMRTLIRRRLAASGH
jgi:hypothetical protein